MTPDAIALFVADGASPLRSNVVIGAFVVFCRVGGCLMLAPGIASPQVPVQVRLFVAMAVSLSMAPVAIDAQFLATLDQPGAATVKAILCELAIGAYIGIMARLFFLALETVASAVATMLGFSNPFGMQVEAGEALSPFATLIASAATVLIFASDLHLELLKGIASSYRTIPIGSDFNPRFALKTLTDVFDLSFRTGLRVCSPFFIYHVVVNFAAGLVSRVTPQISVYYIATPFVLCGGLVLLVFTVRPILDEFESVFGAWLAWG